MAFVSGAGPDRDTELGERADMNRGQQQRAAHRDAPGIAGDLRRWRGKVVRREMEPSQ